MSLNPMRVLTLDEVRIVLRNLHERVRPKRRVYPKLNLVVFRLSCCCGLRRGEIAGLDMRDVILGGPRPGIRIRKDITKGRRAVIGPDGKVISKDKRRARIVPLWWDNGTLLDLQRWVEFRKQFGDGNGGPCQPTSPFVCGVGRGIEGRRLTVGNLWGCWKTAILKLDPERRKMLSIHTGRHTFASLSLAGGHSLAEVRDALGHSSLTNTSIYVHAQVRFDLPDVFALR